MRTILLFQMFETMLKKFMKYSGFSVFYCFVLDLQIKMKFTNRYYPLIHDMEAYSKGKDIKDALNDMYNEYIMRFLFYNIKQSLIRKTSMNDIIRNGCDTYRLVDDRSSYSSMFLGQIINNKSGFILVNIKK